MKIILFFLLFTLSANAELNNLVQINDNLNSSAQKSPSITSDQDGNIYAIWIDYRSNNYGELFFSKSEDQGKSWSDNKFIFNSNIPNSKYQRYATIKSYGDNLYICWMSSINAKIDVFFCKSTDKGETFTNPIIVSDDNSKYNEDFSVMDIDDNGGIHITAIDNRNQEQGKVKFAELMYTHSTDEGESWSTNKIISKLNVNAGACECCWPSIDTFTDKEGNVTVSILYRSNINNLRVGYLVNSFDGGLNFEQPRRVGFTDWIIEFCPVSGPAIIYDNKGILHMTYKTINDVYYSVFDKNNPTNNEYLIASGFNPSIIYNDKLDLTYLTFENYESDRIQSRVVEIMDNSNSGNSNLILPISSKLAMFNLKMITLQGKNFLIWEDDSEGFNKNNIWFAEYSSSVSSIENIFNPPLIRTTTEGNLLISTKESKTKLVISDLMGKIIFEQKLLLPVSDYIVNISNLNGRVYICNVISSTNNTSHLIIK